MYIKIAKVEKTTAAKILESPELTLAYLTKKKEMSFVSESEELVFYIYFLMCLCFVYNEIRIFKSDFRTFLFYYNYSLVHFCDTMFRL